MAETTTFTSLRDELADAWERGQSSSADPIVWDNIGRIINRAERRIAYDVKVQGYQKIATAAFAQGVAVVPKPGDWLRTVSINFATGDGNTVRNMIYPRSYEFVRAICPDDTVTGAPRFYADYDLEHWLIGPTPDASAPFEVMYYGLPQLLDATNQTNWVSETIPHILFSACMVEMAVFLKDDQRAAGLLSVYKDSLGALQREDIQKVVDRAATRRAA
jgi:hypothetical protein